MQYAGLTTLQQHLRYLVLRYQGSPNQVLRLVLTHAARAKGSGQSKYLGKACLGTFAFRETYWLAKHLSPRALTSFASLRKSKICGLTSSINET